MRKAKAKKHTAIRWIFALVVVLSLISFAGIFFLYSKNYSIEFTPADYTESIEPLYNPYVGWVHTYTYELRIEDGYEETVIYDDMDTDTTDRLALLKFDIGDFVDASLSDEALTSITSILDHWAATDKQLLLRFYYETEPQDLSTVYLHMEQLAPILNMYANSIYVVQGVFVGEDGTLRGSAYLTDENIESLASYFDALLDDSIYLAVENSSQYLSATGLGILPTADIAFSSNFPSRVGLFSDFLTLDLSKAEQEATETLTKIAPSGGGISSDMEITSQQEILSILQDRFLTYLYDDDAIAPIKEMSYEGSGIYSGTTVYDYVTNHLGYYYVLSSVSAEYNAWKDEEATITLAIRNKGFSRSYNRFDMTLLLKNTETEEEISIPLEVDNRLWDAQSEEMISGSFDVKKVEKGEYMVYFLMKDASGETILLGNSLTSTSNGYQIGRLHIY